MIHTTSNSARVERICFRATAPCASTRVVGAGARSLSLAELRCAVRAYLFRVRRPATLRTLACQLHRRQRRQTGSCASASSTLRSVAAAMSSGGTHAGNATSTIRWAPEAVCCSSTAASRSAGKRSATRTSAGQIRRWTSVTLPSIRRVATTSPDARRPLRTAKISWPDAWPHQLPRIDSPAICSARFGTGPRADCNTTPCSHTQASGSTRPDSTTVARPFSNAPAKPPQCDDRRVGAGDNDPCRRCSRAGAPMSLRVNAEIFY